MPTWTLAPGETIVRKHLHDEFGGKRFGGIGDSAQTPNVFCFTDPVSGQRHGYNDGWDDTGEVFQYTGEGQVGDQRFTAGNAAIATHVQTGRALRLFRGTGGEVTYMGEFVLDPGQPFLFDDAPQTNDPALRQVIVFRMRPVGGVALEQTDRLLLPTTPEVTAVAVERQHTETFLSEPASEPTEGQRREQLLVVRYQVWLEAAGRHVVRHRYIPEPGAKPLYSDLFDESRDLLVEAKGSVARGSIRMAIGQLADYSRLEVVPPTRAVLLPERPRRDLVELLRSTQIGLIYPTDQHFTEEIDLVA